MVSFCYGLYEDQIGLFDWRHQYIGTPKEILFDQSSPTSKRIYIATEHNVLAALNARTGHIVWRKVFEPQNGVIHRLLSNTNSLLTVSGDGKIVRSWDTVKGNVQWESNALNYGVPQEELLKRSQIIMPKQQAFMLDQEIGGGVLLTSNKMVRLISQNDGTNIWEYEEKKDTIIGAAQHNEEVIAICLRLQDSQKFIMFKYLEVETGKLASEILVPAIWLSSQVKCTVTANMFFVCILPVNKVIAARSLIKKTEEVFLMTDLDSEKFDGEITEHSISTLEVDGSNNMLQVKLNPTYTFLMKLKPDNGIATLVKVLKQPGLFTSFSFPARNLIISIYKDASQTLKIAIYDSKSITDDKPTQLVQTKGSTEMIDSGAPIHCALYMYKKKEDVSFRLLLVSEDHTIFLIQSVGKSDAKLLWSRDEALSTISKVKMIELPPSTSASKLELLHAQFSVQSNAGIFTMFLNRLKSQIRQIQTYADQIKKQRKYSDIPSSSSTSNTDETSTTLTRDQFNIVKIILTFTGGRRLFALNSQNGETVWSSFIPGLSKDFTNNVYLIEQRSTAHFPLPPQVLLFGKCNSLILGDKCKTIVYAFNPLDGSGLLKAAAFEEYELLQASVLPFEDEKSLQVVGIVDTRLNFHIYPNTADTRKKLMERFNSIYFYVANSTSNTFKGYKIKPESNKLSLYEVWSINIPAGQAILKITEKRSDEVVNSVGRVLGDHTVLYKYLNPNLLGVVTRQGEGVRGSLYVYIIDAVTGHIIYQARHKGADEPIELILSEHWFVYLYQNTKGRRTEVSVVEFYEGYEEKNHTAFSSLDPVDASIILSQSYILPVTGVTSMVSTTTERGITNKNILFGLASGYVFSLPKMLLDPRRQFKQTKMLQEEGVPPYMPELPVFPQAFINYNQTISNIRGIYTSAAGLESTSLVLVYGLDLFYTRVTPSKMFDVLKEDFDYIFISGVLSALILVSIVCSKFASMRSLKMAWL